MSSSKKSKAKKVEVRNEGSDPHWAFKPPPGTALLEKLADAGDFDWDSLNDNEDKRELWLIRVPDNVKAKHLEGLEIPLPSSSKGQHLGSLDRKNASFDIWSLGQDGAEDEESAVGGDELKHMSCLLPRKSKKGGNLYLAPTPITRQLVLSKKPATPQPASTSSPLQNPPRHSYPKELLKHQFLPCGALHTTEDMRKDVEKEVEKEAEKDSKLEGLPPSKKRKKSALEGTATPKKSKKAKVSKT